VHTARFLRHLLADDRIEQRLWNVGRVLENKVQEVVVSFVPGFDLLLQALDLLELFAFRLNVRLSKLAAFAINFWFCKFRKRASAAAVAFLIKGPRRCMLTSSLEIFRAR
jgi:hypothetical protein